MARHTSRGPADACELRAAAHGAVLNHAARLLHMSGSPLSRDVARAVLRVRDCVYPLADEAVADTLPPARRSAAHRIAQVPKLDLAPIDCGELIGVLELPVAPPATGYLRPLRRYYEAALAIARTESDATTALIRLDALRVQFAFDADYHAWRRLSISAGACAGVEVLLLQLSSALGRAALKATHQPE